MVSLASHLSQKSRAQAKIVAEANRAHENQLAQDRLLHEHMRADSAKALIAEAAALNDKWEQDRKESIVRNQQVAAEMRATAAAEAQRRLDAVRAAIQKDEEKRQRREKEMNDFFHRQRVESALAEANQIARNADMNRAYEALLQKQELERVTTELRDQRWQQQWDSLTTQPVQAIQRPIGVPTHARLMRSGSGYAWFW